MELGNQFGSAIIVAYFLEALKHSRFFPLLSDENTKRYKMIAGGIAAFLVTVGIHYTFDYNPTGNGVLTITLPTLEQFGHAIFDFAKQWAFQQGAYDSMVKTTAPVVVKHELPSSLPKTDTQGNVLAGP